VLYVLLGLITLTCLAVGLYGILKKSKLQAQITELRKQLEEQETESNAAVERLQGELAELTRYAHLPDIFERAKKTERQVEAKLEQARRQADETVHRASTEAQKISTEIAARQEEAQQRVYEILAKATQEAKQTPGLTHHNG
jgi:hypothetical protein